TTSTARPPPTTGSPPHWSSVWRHPGLGSAIDRRAVVRGLADLLGEAAEFALLAPFSAPRSLRRCRSRDCRRFRPILGAPLRIATARVGREPAPALDSPVTV